MPEGLLYLSEGLVFIHISVHACVCVSACVHTSAAHGRASWVLEAFLWYGPIN